MSEYGKKKCDNHRPTNDIVQRILVVWPVKQISLTLLNMKFDSKDQGRNI